MENTIDYVMIILISVSTGLIFGIIGFLSIIEISFPIWRDIKGVREQQPATPQTV